MGFCARARVEALRAKRARRVLLSGGASAFWHVVVVVEFGRACENAKSSNVAISPLVAGGSAELQAKYIIESKMHGGWIFGFYKLYKRKLSGYAVPTVPTTRILWLGVRSFF